MVLPPTPQANSPAAASHFFLFLLPSLVRGKARSDKYAKENNLPTYDNVLHPRTTGFIHSLAILRPTIDAVYDITVGYPKGIPGRLSLIKGEFPEEIHFHCKRYPIQEIPESEEESSKWLQDLWANKEKALKEFYVKGKFDGPARICAKNTNPNSLKPKMLASFVFWHLISVGLATLMWYSPYAVYYFFFSQAVFMGVTHFGGGFDHIEVNMLHSSIKAGTHHRYSLPDNKKKKE